MDPAAMVCFVGFPGVPPPLLLPEDGAPAGTARRLAGADPGAAARTLPERLHRLPEVNSGAGVRAGAVACLYRYEVRLHRRRRETLWIACWRRYPGVLGWQRRCGPMPLRTFLERFLPRV